MMNRSVMDRQMFANGGMALAPGVAGAAAQSAMPQDAAAAASSSMDPAVLQQMLADAQSSISNLDQAEDFETVINTMRGNEAPLEERYGELAEIVGEEDASRTPESVLALVQPVIMMSAVDEGIGSLAQEEMTQPVEGDMAGGIMSTVAQPPQEAEMMPPMGMEGPPPVNFNQGGLVRRGDNQPVQYFNPQNANRVAGADPFGNVPGRLGELSQERYLARQGILGDTAAQIAEQENLAKAKMYFDIANTALAFAAPMEGERPGMSPAERLAYAARTTKLPEMLTSRAQKVADLKQAIKGQEQQLKLSALTSAEQALAKEAEVAATSALAKQKAAQEITLQNLKYAQDLAKMDRQAVLDKNVQGALETLKQTGRIEIKNIEGAQSMSLEELKQKGAITLEDYRQVNRLALEDRLQDNRKNMEILKATGRQSDLILADRLEKENIELRGNIELGKMAVANGYELNKMDKAHEQATELQNSRLTVQQNIADNRLKLDTLNSTLNQARADKELQIQQKRLDLARETEARIKSLEEQKLALDTRKVDLEAAASSLDRFGTSVDGRIMNIITGKGVFQPDETAAMLADRYGRGETTSDEDITLNQAIEYFVAPKPVWDADNRRYTLTEGNKLAQEWRQAIEKRQGLKGKTVPTLGDSSATGAGIPKSGSVSSAADSVLKGLTASAGDLPRFDSTGQPIDIKDTTYQSIIAGLDPTLATGSPTAFKQVLNRTVETLLPIFNQPFPETSRAADMLNNLNTLTTVIQMQALPGKEGEQLRAELKNVLPEPASWTKGDQTAYNKIKNTIANLNASLVVLYSGAATSSEAGQIERNIVALNTIKDAYAQLGRGYELKMGGGVSDEKLYQGLFK